MKTTTTRRNLFHANALASLAFTLLFAARLAAQPPTSPIDRSSEWRGDPDIYMVAIEALVVEVDENKTRELGLRYGLKRSSDGEIVEGADINLGQPPSAVLVPTFRGDDRGRTSTGFVPRLPGLGVSLSGMDVNGAVVSARLRALLDKGQARITTRPIVLARNRTATTIHVGSTIPYQDVRGDMGVPIVAEHVVGVNLNLTPNIDLARQMVHLDILQVEVSSVPSFVTSRNVDRPIVNRSDTRTKATIRSGETYQLSSLKGHRSRETREGIPILMHIPMLGHLFSSRKEVHEAVDILFFVTPHIVPPGKNILLPYDFLHGNELEAEGVELAK